MSWIMKGLLLAVGGLIGYGLSEVSRNDDENDVTRLLANIRREAILAMAECETEAEREEVYAQIRESVEKMKTELQEKGDALISELREMAAAARQIDGTKPETPVGNRVAAIKATLEKVSESLDETLESLKPQEA